ncbi:hypothetical protein EV12_0397 [Prochlorococcus sp. MIT 0701]|nr:hypothetical protein EV12_0397 [Prochlorococcus sp. MIT 0701]
MGVSIALGLILITLPMFRRGMGHNSFGGVALSSWTAFSNQT